MIYPLLTLNENPPFAGESVGYRQRTPYERKNKTMQKNSITMPQVNKARIAFTQKKMTAYGGLALIASLPAPTFYGILCLVEPDAEDRTVAASSPLQKISVSVTRTNREHLSRPDHTSRSTSYPRISLWRGLWDGSMGTFFNISIHSICRCYQQLLIAGQAVVRMQNHLLYSLFTCL